MKNNNLVIYLAGKMSGIDFDTQTRWRLFVKNGLERCAATTDCNVKVLSPCDYYNFEKPRHQNELEVMKYDLSLVHNSDIVIVNVSGLHTSIGSVIEIYEAWKSDIPVLAYNEDRSYDKLHPWIKNCITRVETCAVDLCNYVKDFYMS